ncbi:MAG: hypothetical protein LUH15_10360 [Tannerellaceae bacterium]|nr:hypothetical protein [Tannerellaceae bacterium]
MKNYTFISILVLLTLLVSCNYSRDRKWLEAALPYMDYKIDSVFYYLNKIEDPGKLPEADWALYQYIFNLTGMHVWNHPVGKVPEDLEKATHIFIRQNDSLKIANCFSGLANLRRNVGDFAGSDSLFLESLRYMDTPGFVFQCYRNLAMNSLQQGQPEKSLIYNQQLLNDLPSFSPFQQLLILADRGEIFQIKEDADSMFYFYDLALKQAHALENDYILAFIHKKRSQFYEQMNDRQQAFNELIISTEYDKNRNSRPHYQFLKAKIYLSTGEKDSAEFYLRKAIQTPNPYVAARAYEYLSHLYRIQEKDSLALVALHLYNHHFDVLADKSNTGSIRYQEDKLRYENRELKFLKKQRELYLLLVSLLAVLLCALGYIIYLFERKKKQQQKEQLKRVLLENQVEQLEHEKEISNLKERTAILREQFFRQLSVAGKIPSLSGRKKQDSKEEKSRLTPEDLKELIDMVNTVWPGFTERLQNMYPVLREKDIAFCCLIKCRITTKDLSDIYYVTPSAISQKKTG